MACNIGVANAIGFKQNKTETIETKVKKALILCYNIKKQGATNENMASNPYLIDLSGNGHNAIVNNLDWTEECGIDMTTHPYSLVIAKGEGNGESKDKLRNIFAEGLPLIDDYTIIVNRETDSSQYGKTGFPCYKGGIVGGSGGNQVFGFEEHGLATIGSSSFGLPTVTSLRSSGYSYQTKNSYNGTYISSGKAVDVIGDFKVCFHTNMYNYKCIMYSMALFNRSLTKEEIDWAINNILE